MKNRLTKSGVIELMRKLEANWWTIYDAVSDPGASEEVRYDYTKGGDSDKAIEEFEFAMREIFPPGNYRIVFCKNGQVTKKELEFKNPHPTPAVAPGVGAVQPEQKVFSSHQEAEGFRQVIRTEERDRLDGLMGAMEKRLELKSELVILRDKVARLEAENKDLNDEIRTMDKELARIESENNLVSFNAGQAGMGAIVKLLTMAGINAETMTPGGAGTAGAKKQKRTTEF